MVDAVPVLADNPCATVLVLVSLYVYASFETVSSGAFMCDVRCTVQIFYSWYSLGIEGAGVRKCLSLSERGGITS